MKTSEVERVAVFYVYSCPIMLSFCLDVLANVDVIGLTKSIGSTDTALDPWNFIIFTTAVRP